MIILTDEERAALFKRGNELFAKDIAKMRTLAFEMEEAFTKMQENLTEDNAMAFAAAAGKFGNVANRLQETMPYLLDVTEGMIVNEQSNPSRH